jgi:hypothetical protein
VEDIFNQGQTAGAGTTIFHFSFINGHFPLTDTLQPKMPNEK